jgi:excisionase family DNA binding protein
MGTTTPTSAGSPGTGPHGSSHDLDQPLPLLIPVPQAARLIGISRAAAYRFAASGDLPARRLGRRVYVVSATVHDFALPRGRTA